MLSALEIASMVIGRGIDEVADDLVVGPGSRRRRRRWRQGGQPGIGRLNEGFEFVSNHHKLDVPNGGVTGAASMYSFSAATGTCHLLFTFVPESLPLAKRWTTMLTGTCSRSATWRVVRHSTVMSPFAASSWPGHLVQFNKSPLDAPAETPHAPQSP